MKSVKNVREYLAGCIVQNVSFTEETFKKFIQLQNKLHDTICEKRNSATIATHDFNKLVRYEFVPIFTLFQILFWTISRLYISQVLEYIC